MLVAWWAKRLLHGGSPRGPETTCGSRAVQTRSGACPHERPRAVTGAVSACARILLGAHHARNGAQWGPQCDSVIARGSGRGGA
eukprot:3116588-Prorocentrum_lima.AAC.1